MASLFEAWVGQTLRRRLLNQGYEVRLQGPFGWALTHEGTTTGRFRTIPDITIWRDGTCSILDTKWKLLDETNSKLGVSQADVYQLCAYARVYDAVSIALLFPHHGGLEISPGTVGRYRVVGADIPFHMISIDLSDLDRASASIAHLVVEFERA
jgi:5-methylcytosine-specific restriction enzyme subunit McrC